MSNRAHDIFKVCAFCYGLYKIGVISDAELLQAQTLGYCSTYCLQYSVLHRKDKKPNTGQAS